jgi:predicted ArsR family transcriptional regulator
VEALPNYVVESRIVRFLKKDKSGKPDAIAKEVGSNEELIKVLLEQLIKKEFVKKEGDVYHYLP